MLLFAAASSVDPFDDLPLGVWIALIVGILLLVAFVSVCWLVTQHLRRSRELLSAERIKALEIGQSPNFSPPDRSKERYSHNAFWIAFWVGAGVPMATVWASAVATREGRFEHHGIVLALWICATVICVASVVCATVLMVNVRRVVVDSARHPVKIPTDKLPT
jgi:threonine/homoserine/homoserine lactone efflux protein